MGPAFTLQLAFRNTLRNRRRTLLTMLTVMLGTALLTLALSWLAGIQQGIFREAARATGHARVVSQAYQDREMLRPLYENIPETGTLVQELAAHPDVVQAYPRIQLNVLASVSGDEVGELFAMLIGAPVGFYDQVMDFRPRISEGSFLTGGPNEILLGRLLAQDMKVGVGDNAIFIGQTQDGSMAPMRARVVGIVDSGNGMYDRGAYVDIEQARWMADIPEGAVEVLVYGNEFGTAEALADVLRPAVTDFSTRVGFLEPAPDEEPPRLVIQAWSEREPYNQMVEVSAAILRIISAIIVFITALGVLNTMLMSVLERRGEIGVLRAMGMEVRGVMALFVVEALVISAVGGAMGALVGSGLSVFFEDRGIDLGSAAEGMASTMPINRMLHPDWTPEYAITAFVLGLVMALIGSLLPALHAAAISPVRAMRSTNR